MENMNGLSQEMLMKSEKNYYSRFGSPASVGEESKKDIEKSSWQAVIMTVGSIFCYGVLSQVSFWFIPAGIIATVIAVYVYNKGGQ